MIGGAVWSGSKLFAIPSPPFDALLYGKATLFKFKDNYSICFECPNF